MSATIISLSPCNSFFIYLPGLSVMFSPFPNFTPNFCSVLHIRFFFWFVLVHLQLLDGRIFFHYFLMFEFFLVFFFVGEWLVFVFFLFCFFVFLFFCIALTCAVSFKTPFFLNILYISSDLPPVLFWSSHPNISLHFFFLSDFACCHNFFTHPSSPISYPGFVFQFEFRRETPILSQSNIPSV